jgi:ABC-type proline/glycine betaine transport system substrate-binding protein
MKKNLTLLFAAAMFLLVATSSCGKRKESCAAYDRVQVQQTK